MSYWRDVKHFFKEGNQINSKKEVSKLIFFFLASDDESRGAAFKNIF